MRYLLRSLAILSALSLPLIAHADSVVYTGTVTLTDGATTVGSNSFSFTDPGTFFGTGSPFNPFDDSFSIDGKIKTGDTISLGVSFTAPGSGNGAFDGEVYKGIFGGDTIDWTIPAGDQINLSNGSAADISLGFLGFTLPTPLTSCGRRDSGDFCGSSDLYIAITDNDPATTTPEPSSLILLGTGVLGAAGMVRRRLAV
jgi:hypothetical protein